AARSRTMPSSAGPEPPGPLPSCRAPTRCGGGKTRGPFWAATPGRPPGTAAVTLFPYGLISRHGTPPPGYGVSHEGPIGVMGDKCLRQSGIGFYTECQEESYKTLEEKKEIKFEVVNAWFGFADKYWAATLLPGTDAKLQAKFSSGQ